MLDVYGTIGRWARACECELEVDGRRAVGKGNAGNSMIIARNFVSLKNGLEGGDERDGFVTPS